MAYQRKVFLQDVDVTGRIYFAVVFNYAMEAFQSRLQAQGKSLQTFFRSGYGLPIVHAEANYYLSLTVGDEVSVSVFVTNIGERSFTTVSKIEKIGGALAAEVTLVHAFVEEGKEKASQIPTEIRNFLTQMT